MGEGTIDSGDAIELIERARRAALHRQIGALQLKLSHWQWFGDADARAKAAKLRNKISRLRRKLKQGELQLAARSKV